MINTSLHDLILFVNILSQIIVSSTCGVICVKPIKTSISITIDDPILKQVKYLAEQEDRSLSSYINLVLKAHLEQLEQKKEQTPGV